MLAKVTALVETLQHNLQGRSWSHASLPSKNGAGKLGWNTVLMGPRRYSLLFSAEGERRRVSGRTHVSG